MTNVINAHHDDEQPRPVFVGVFDVLGFKARLQRVPLPRLVEDYKRLLDAKQWAATIPVLGAQGAELWTVGTTVFSDTVVIWCDDGKEQVDTFLAACSVFVAAAIDAGWPMRGGVAYGSVVMSRRQRIFVGQPIVDAYLLEQSQQWVGAAVHQSCCDHPILGGFIAKHDEVIPYPVPTGRKKNRVRSTLAVHWGPHSSLGRSRLQTMRREAPSCRDKRKYDRALRYLKRKCSDTSAWHAA